MQGFGLGTSLFAGAFAASVGLAGCGGDEGSKKVNSPSGASGDGGAAASASAGVSATPVQTSDLSGSAKSDYDKGWQAWQAGDLLGAKKAFSSAAEDDPKSPAPHFALGTVMDRLGDSAGAQQEYRASFALKPDYDPAISAYALSLASSGHAGEADTFVTDKHQKYPDSAAITTILADIKSIEKDSGTAQQLAQDALRVNPDYKPAMVTIARDHWRAGRPELAKYALQAVLDGFDPTPPRDKDNPDAHLLRGLIERQAGQRAAAMADFDAAQRKRPDLVEALVQLGEMKDEAGNVQEALPLLEAAVRYAPNSGVGHLDLGDAYRLANRPADAKKEFDTALALDSSLAQAHYDMGLLYLFSTSIPGMNASDQVGAAIRELNTFKTMRGALGARGNKDDTDELLSRANAKQAEIKQGVAGPAPASTGSANVTPAKGGGK